MHKNGRGGGEIAGDEAAVVAGTRGQRWCACSALGKISFEAGDDLPTTHTVEAGSRGNTRPEKGDQLCGSRMFFRMLCTGAECDEECWARHFTFCEIGNAGLEEVYLLRIGRQLKSLPLFGFARVAMFETEISPRGIRGVGRDVIQGTVFAEAGTGCFVSNSSSTTASSNTSTVTRETKQGLPTLRAFLDNLSFHRG